MRFTCIINSIALAKDAARPSSGSRPYAERAWLLRNVILPWYASLGVFDEVVVAGEFEEGLFHRYVPCAQVFHTVGDALLQRQLGFEATTGHPDDWVLFQHDDHLWAPENETLGVSVAADRALSPSRWTRARRATGEALNDGHLVPHINGHALLMRRRIAALVPWTSVPPVFTWDVEYTAALARAGVAWRYAPEYAVWDLERGAEPWK